MKYWLFKSEPDVYSIDDLKEARVDTWDGVRNYQARNNMKEMKKGDLGFFYHSRISPPAVVGICKVTKEAYPDKTAFDPEEKYYDPKSDKKNPRWFMVNVRYVRHFRKPISIDQIKAEESLQDMVLVNNTRLSVQPVTEEEFEKICKMGGLRKIPGKK